MRVALDAMGGDRAPQETVLGALEALADEPGLEVILVGREDAIRAELAGQTYDAARLSVVHAADVIDCHESPADALRKKRDSSIHKCFALGLEGKADGVISAGSTGAWVGAATLIWRLLPGIRRAGIAVALGTRDHSTVLIDVGANVNCKPDNLLHYGLMASIYAERVLGRAQPRVALLNIGEEEAKGNELVKETRRLFEEAPFRFIGHVEGNHIFAEAADVIVCEGFVGNVVLKVAEGLSERLHRHFEEALQALDTSQDSGFRKMLGDVRRRTDYAEVGGAALLGVNGTCIIAHGRSDRRAIRNAVKLTNRFAGARVNELILEGLQKVRSSVGGAS